VAECGTRNAEYRSQESGVRSQERRGQDIGSDGCVRPDGTVGLSPGFQPWVIDSPERFALKGRSDQASPAGSGDPPFRAHALRDLKISADPVALAHYKTE
jgi:hypothetical protein